MKTRAMCDRGAVGPTARIMNQAQATVLRRTLLTLSALLFVVGAYWIGRAFIVDGQLRFGNPVAGDTIGGMPSDGQDAQPRRVRAEVTRVRGAAVVRAGDKCEFLVERRPLDNGSFYCNAQVVCGGKLIYGGPERGFFACALYEEPRRDIVGSDPSTTSADHDAALHLDTQAGVLRVWDDARGVLGAFEIEADVLDVQ
jgi:hypothetical protein